MITGVDHIVLIVPDIVSGTAVYERLLGRKADWRSEVEGGGASAMFRFGNTALELLAPSGTGSLSDRLMDMIEADGPGVTTLVFVSDAIEADQHVLARRGLNPGEISEGRSVETGTGAVRSWRRFRIGEADAAGLKLFVIKPREGALPEVPCGSDAVHSLDHLVINTFAPERAVAFYGARLGLRLALDRTNADWGARFLFFRTGGLTLEVVQKLSEAEDASRPDKFLGFTWAVQDLEAAHARLTDAGFDVSEIRRGRKPGSRVFTVRNGTMNVPTLFIAHEPV